MRILQLGFVPIEAGGQGTGGIATHLWELSENLVKLGHRVQVFALNRLKQDITVQNIRIHHFPSSAEPLLFPLISPPPKALFRAAKSSKGGFFKGIGKAYWVQKILRAAKPDLVHNHLPGFFFGPVMRALDPDLPMVLTLHSVHDITHNISKDSDHIARITALFQANLQAADAVITVHPHVAEQAKELGLSWDAPTFPVINAVSSKGFDIIERFKARKELGLETGVKMILFSGIMTGRKGEQELIRAAQLLPDDVRVLMIGYGPKENRAKQLIKDLGLQNRVQVIGPVAREKMRLFYNASELFVLPSHSEGFALSYLESLLCGTPFVADKNIPQELINQEACVLVDARDPKDIARGILQALAKTWDRNIIRRFGLRFAWGPEKAGEYLEVYERAIGIRKALQ